MSVKGKVNYKEVLRGDQGFHFTPHITDDGVLHWTNNGNLKNPPPFKVKGSIENLNFKIDNRGHLIVY